MGFLANVSSILCRQTPIACHIKVALAILTFVDEGNEMFACPAFTRPNLPAARVAFAAFSLKDTQPDAGRYRRVVSLAYPFWNGAAHAALACGSSEGSTPIMRATTSMIFSLDC